MGVRNRVVDRCGEKTHTRPVVDVHRSLMLDRDGSRKWSCGVECHENGGAAKKGENQHT